MLDGHPPVASPVHGPEDETASSQRLLSGQGLATFRPSLASPDDGSHFFAACLRATSVACDPVWFGNRAYVCGQSSIFRSIVQLC